MKKYYQQIAITLAILMTFMTMSPTLLLASEATGSSTTPTATEENQSGNQETAAALSSDCKVTAKDGAPTLNGTPVFISGQTPGTIIIQEQTGSGWTIANLNSLQPEKITLGDAFKDLKVTSVEAVPREKDPTTADQIAIKVDGDVNSDGMVGDQYVPDIYKKGTVQIDKSVLGTASDLNLETDVITPSITLKDLQADGKAVESIPADAKTITGTLAVDSDVKDVGWFCESKTDGTVNNPNAVAYLALGGALGSSTIALGSPSVTGTLKNEIPFTITLDANRSATGDGTITVPAEENCFGSALSVTIPVTAPEKTAETATPTADVTTTTQTTPQTTAEQGTEPTTTVDQNTAIQNVTESVKETPVLSLASGIINTLSAKGLEITNANEYYAGQSVDSMTLKATGGVTFAQNLSADGFALQNGFSQLSIDSIKRDSDVQITLNLKKGNQIVNGIDDENKGWIAYDNGQITVKSNQLSGEATQDMTAEVPVATPNVVLKDVKADAKGIKTNGATAQNISSDTKVITGTIQLDNVPATYSCFKSKMGTLDMISSNSIILGGAFNKVTDAEFEINPNNKNEVKFSITIPEEMTASTGSITIPAQYNCFDQDMTVNFNIDTITANLNENLTYKQKDGDANTLVYTAKINVNGGKIKKDISAEDIAFTGGFESCKTTDVSTDKANGIITVTFTKARYLDSSAMNGTVVVKGSGQVIAYASTNRSYSSDLSCQLVDPVDHQKAESSTAWKQTYGFNSTTFGNKVTGNLLTKDIPLFIRTVFSDFAKTSGFPIVSSIFNLLGAVWDSTSLNSAKDVLTLDKIEASLHSEITKSSIFVNEKITENSIKTKLSNIGTQLTNYSNDYAGNLAKAQKSSDNLIKYTNMINNGQTAEEVGLQEADIDEMNAAFGNLYQSYATQTVLPTLGGKSTKDAYYAYAVSVNSTTSDKAYAKQVLDFCNLSNQILDGKIVSETNTGKTGDEALVATKTLKVGDENVFTAYKEYLSLKYNYNSQTFKEREAFNDNMYKCIKALNGSYYSAVAYDALILKMTNAGYQQTLDENQAIIDNPAGHTAEEIADATKGNEAIKKMITVVNNSLEEDNALLDSLEKQEKALEEAYAGAKKDLNDEKEAKFVTCYRNGHQYDFHVADINEGINTNNRSILKYFDSSVAKETEKYIYQVGESYTKTTNKIYKVISKEDMKELNAVAEYRGKSLYEDLMEAASKFYSGTNTMENVNKVSWGDQERTWNIDKHTQNKWSWARMMMRDVFDFWEVQRTFSGYYLTAKQPAYNGEKITSLKVHWDVYDAHAVSPWLKVGVGFAADKNNELFKNDGEKMKQFTNFKVKMVENVLTIQDHQ